MIELEGFDEAILAINSLMDTVPEIVEAIAHRLKQVAMDETPVDTGSMKRAWVVKDAKVIINPTAVNSRSGVKVTDYAGVIIERQGIVDAMLKKAPRITKQEAQRGNFT